MRTSSVSGDCAGTRTGGISVGDGGPVTSISILLLIPRAFFGLRRGVS